jgi:hypothetical protein
MKTGHEILEELLAAAILQRSRALIITNETADKINFVARCLSNRATGLSFGENPTPGN